MLGRRQGLASLLARWLRSSARAARCSARAAPCGRASSGCVPSPPFPPSSSPRACSTRAQSARGSPRRMSGRGHRVARSRARLFPARLAARTRSPPRPRGRPARPDRARHRLAPLGFLAVWANSQDERLFLVDFSATRRGGDDDARVFAPSRDARLFVHARHTTDPRLTRSLSSFPSTWPKRRATTSAGRTATRCPCSWMAWRRTCRKA